VVIRKVYEYSETHHIDKVVLYWQGGEVFTLGPSWFERMDEIVSQVFGSSTIRIRHRIQSNLISYTSKCKPVIKKTFQNSIGSSLDYPSLYRGFPTTKKEQFNDIWLKYCNRARSDGIDVSVISVLNKESLEIPPIEFLKFYSNGMGISNMQLNFPFDLHSHFKSESSFFLDPSELGKFLVDLFDTWIDESSSWYRKLHINPFCELIDVFSFAPRPSRCNCIWSGNCADTFFSIGPDSSVGLCDCWVTSLPEFSFGNLQTQTLDEISHSPVREKFAQRIESVMESECADCPFLSVCFGGCIVRTYGNNGTIEGKDPYCEAYKMLFSSVQRYVRSTKISGGNHAEARRTA
jgi:radical SAM protein with 4Fe4S-binding SPASM domain